MAPAAARHGEWIIEGVKDVERERESYIYDGSKYWFCGERMIETIGRNRGDDLVSRRNKFFFFFFFSSSQVRANFILHKHPRFNNNSI